MQQMHHTAPIPAPAPTPTIQVSRASGSESNLSANQWALGGGARSVPLPPLRPPQPKENGPDDGVNESRASGKEISSAQPAPPGTDNRKRQSSAGGKAEISRDTSKLPLPPLPPEAYRRAAAAAMAAEKKMAENAFSSEPTRQVEMFDAILNDEKDDDDDDDD